MVNNFAILVNRIIPSVREEIDNYHLLAEHSIEKEYTVFLRIQVNKKVLESLAMAGALSTGEIGLFRMLRENEDSSLADLLSEIGRTLRLAFD